jgi:hypothetical protein
MKHYMKFLELMKQLYKTILLNEIKIYKLLLMQELEWFLGVTLLRIKALNTSSTKSNQTECHLL